MAITLRQIPNTILYEEMKVLLVVGTSAATRIEEIFMQYYTLLFYYDSPVKAVPVVVCVVVLAM